MTTTTNNNNNNNTTNNNTTNKDVDITNKRTVSPSQGEKRSRPESIGGDITTDDDDDEEPIRRPCILQRTDLAVDIATTLSIRKIVVTDLWSQDLEIQKRVMMNLLEYTNDADEDVHAEKQAQLMQVGGHLDMQWRPECSEIQEFGIKNLVSATYKNDDLKIAIAAVGGTVAIVEAMSRFPNNRSITFSGLKALSNLAIHADNAEILVNDATNGIPVILERLASYKEDYDITLWGCRVLHKVSIVESLRNALFQANALSTLGMCLENHKTCAKIFKAATDAMATLVSHVQSKQHEMASMGD